MEGCGYGIVKGSHRSANELQSTAGGYLSRSGFHHRYLSICCYTSMMLDSAWTHWPESESVGLSPNICTDRDGYFGTARSLEVR